MGRTFTVQARTGCAKSFRCSLKPSPTRKFWIYIPNCQEGLPCHGRFPEDSKESVTLLIYIDIFLEYFEKRACSHDQILHAYYVLHGRSRYKCGDEMRQNNTNGVLTGTRFLCTPMKCIAGVSFNWRMAEGIKVRP